nr:hypothetical protein CFP56_76221 [Quercus suber]
MLCLQVKQHSKQSLERHGSSNRECLAAYVPALTTFQLPSQSQRPSSSNTIDRGNYGHDDRTADNRWCAPDCKSCLPSDLHEAELVAKTADLKDSAYWCCVADATDERRSYIG